MANLVAVHGAGLVDASTDQSGAAVRLSTGPLKCRLQTANGSATAAGTEVATGGGYTSGAGAPTATFGAANTTTATAATTAAINVTNYPRAETVVGIELWDSAGSPLRKWFGALTASKTMAAADTFSIASGALTVQDL
jgi:hypothetical protein